ncbi:MAG: PAS domain S-box protein [Leptospira sp.]|nr:PAS domain S-box protein [Leptospira sp.]
MQTILLVEDEKLISLASMKLIKSFGYNVELASSGLEAIECIKCLPEIDLVLMDIDLGAGIDGTEAALEILKIRNLPIIFLTSHSEESYVSKVKGITRYGYIIKNSGENVLRTSIEMGLELFIAHKKLQQSEDYLSITFQSIGDAVVATDTQGLITRMNPKAEELTGWKYSEAKGLEFNKIFRIYNSITKRNVDNPLDKVLLTGEVVGLANHTVLISKSGREYQISDSAAPIRDSEGIVRGVIIVFSDVTEKYKQEEEIRKSEEKYRNLITNLTSGLVVHNPDTSITYANQTACDLLGLSLDQLQGKKAIHPEWAFINEDGSVMEEKDFPINKIFRDKAILKNYLVGFRKTNHGYPTWVLCNAFPVYDESSNLLEGIVTFHEVTERIQMEHSILASNKELDLMLEQKGILIKEIHHRVKNNLVLISSLLSLQADESTDEKLKVSLKDAESRVCGMINLYNQLFINENNSAVSVKIYLEDLLTNIKEIYSAFSDFDLKYEIEDIDVDTKVIINLGIIVNEVITNSIKYAFPKNQKGIIQIHLNKVGNDVRLVISDNGVGFSINQKEKGFGLRLIEMLVKQLKGESIFVWENGTNFTLQFRVK